MKPCFVFGSNLAGRHGKGAALYAHRHMGAVYGVGVGRTGNAYAIPTKDERLVPLTLDEIEGHIVDFLSYAHNNPETYFNLTPIGTGLAGFTKYEILKIIHKHNIPDNVLFNRRWVKE